MIWHLLIGFVTGATTVIISIVIVAMSEYKKYNKEETRQGGNTLPQIKER